MLFCILVFAWASHTHAKGEHFRKKKKKLSYKVSILEKVLKLVGSKTSLCAVFVTSVFTVKKQVSTVKLMLLDWSLVYQSVHWTDSKEQRVF